MGGPLSIVAPKARKHLSADALFYVVRSGFATIPDSRCEDGDISFTDARMAAFALFSLTAPSLLACDKERAEGNVHTIYGMARVPCDTHRRASLEPVSPKWLRPVCTSVCRQRQRGKALEERLFLDGHYVLALDGTGYLSSQTMHCASCLHQVHRHGSITSYQQMLGAAMIHPDRRAVMPLMPAPIVAHDGTGQNDGERHAANRFIAKLRHDHPHRKCIVTADSLRSHAPHIETLHEHGLHDMLGVKDGDQAHRFTQVPAAEPAGRVTYYERHDRAAGGVHRFRFVNDVPRNASNAHVQVNCMAYWAIGHGQPQHLSWGTDLRVSKRTVYRLMRGGRARWKIANETCTTLKNQGDNFAHTYGHGAQHLSVVCAMVMMLAFVVDQTPQLCCAVFRAVGTKLGSKRLLWERMRALFDDYALQSMRPLFDTLFYGLKKLPPLLTVDSS